MSALDEKMVSCFPYEYVDYVEMDDCTHHPMEKSGSCTFSRPSASENSIWDNIGSIDRISAPYEFIVSVCFENGKPTLVKVTMDWDTTEEPILTIGYDT